MTSLPTIVHIVDDDESFELQPADSCAPVATRSRAMSWRNNCWSGCRMTRDLACILLDVQIPGVSGPELQDRLNALGSSLPIIFLDRPCRHSNDRAVSSRPARRTF